MKPFAHSCVEKHHAAVVAKAQGLHKSVMSPVVASTGAPLHFWKANRNGDQEQGSKEEYRKRANSISPQTAVPEVASLFSGALWIFPS